MLVSDIAQHLNSPWEGVDVEIDGAAPLESAGPAEIAFVSGRKAAAQAGVSRAGCLIVPEDFPAGRNLIRTKNPRAAFARTVALLSPKMPVRGGIDHTAVVASDAVVEPDVWIGPHVVIGAGAKIGSGSSLGPGCSVGARVRIGRGCTLHANVVLYDDVAVGDRCILHSGCVLGADGFGFVLQEGRYEKFPQIGRVEIGDDVEIGANACVDRAALGITCIGDGTKLDNMVHVGHNCRIGKHVVVAAQTGFSGGVVVEDYAVIGGQVGIGDKARIESGAVLGSGSGVLTSKIVRKGQVLWGTPARPLREHLEQLASLAKLPEVRAQIAEIQRQLKGLVERR